MADNLLEDVREFLTDVVSDLTGLHVKAAQYQNAPTDQDAVDELAKLPAGLIDRAQALSARLEKSDDSDEKADEKAKPKPKAKTAAGASRG